MKTIAERFTQKRKLQAAGSAAQQAAEAAEAAGPYPYKEESRNQPVKPMLAWWVDPQGNAVEDFMHNDPSHGGPEMRAKNKPKFDAGFMYCYTADSQNKGLIYTSSKRPTAAQGAWLKQKEAELGAKARPVFAASSVIKKAQGESPEAEAFITRAGVLYDELSEAYLVESGKKFNPKHSYSSGFRPGLQNSEALDYLEKVGVVRLAIYEYDSSAVLEGVNDHMSVPPLTAQQVAAIKNFAKDRKFYVESGNPENKVLFDYRRNKRAPIGLEHPDYNR